MTSPNLKKALTGLHKATKAILAPRQDVPATLYHYTSAEGLRGILKDGSVWATESQYLNDPDEVRLGSDLMLRVARELTEEGMRGVVSAYAERQPDNWFEGGAIFLASFSKKRSDLSQWLAYGDQGRGFAIGFDLRGNLPSDLEDNACRQVRYDANAMEVAFREALTEYHRIADEVHDEHLLFDDEGGLYGDSQAFFVEAAQGVGRILEWACAFKDKAYLHEEEWRLLAPLAFVEGGSVKARIRARSSNERPLWIRKRAAPRV